MPRHPRVMAVAIASMAVRSSPFVFWCNWCNSSSSYLAARCSNWCWVSRYSFHSSQAISNSSESQNFLENAFSLLTDLFTSLLLSLLGGPIGPPLRTDWSSPADRLVLPSGPVGPPDRLVLPWTVWSSFVLIILATPLVVVSTMPICSNFDTARRTERQLTPNISANCSFVLYASMPCCCHVQASHQMAICKPLNAPACRWMNSGICRYFTPAHPVPLRQSPPSPHPPPHRQ